MRWFALTALLGSLAASTTLVGQSLTEHAAAAAGATVGTAVGKPLGTALGKVFGEVDKSTATVATPKTKPVIVKPTPAATSETKAYAPVAATSTVGGGGDGGGGDGASHRSTRRSPVQAEPGAKEPPPAVPVAAIIPEPPIKEPSAQDVASIKVGATLSEVRDALGAPESRISIPGDDGHLIEICQYWAKGQQVGTVRLDNGLVVSVRANN